MSSAHERLSILVRPLLSDGASTLGPRRSARPNLRSDSLSGSMVSSDGRVRLGGVGFSANYGWATRAHIPALKSMPNHELIAVCTSKEETAAKAKEFYGTKYGFHSYVDCASCPDVDAISVSVSCPGHHPMVLAGLGAGKPCFCEWPLGKNTQEAIEMADKARAQKLQGCVGLQARGIPELLRIRELLQEGFVGRVLTANLTEFLAGAKERGTYSWRMKEENGVNTLTIASGHAIDIFRYVVGDFAEFICDSSTRLKTWETPAEFKDMFRSSAPAPSVDALMAPIVPDAEAEVTAPDTVMLHGNLVNGAGASVHISTVPYHGQGWHLEIYGTEGTIVAGSDVMMQFGPGIWLKGARASKQSAVSGSGQQLLEPLEVPARLRIAPPDVPSHLAPANSCGLAVGQLYQAFADGVAGKPVPEWYPSFDVAVKMHKFLDLMRESSKTRQWVKVPEDVQY